MSFVTKGTEKITDLDALRVAANALGLEMIQQNFYRAHEGEVRGCEHVLRIPEAARNLHASEYGYGKYDVGVIPHADGHYNIAYDIFEYGYGLCAILGDTDRQVKAPKLFMEYRVARDIMEAERNGQTIARYGARDGSVFLGTHYEIQAVMLAEGIALEEGDTMLTVETGGW